MVCPAAAGTPRARGSLTRQKESARQGERDARGKPATFDPATGEVRGSGSGAGGEGNPNEDYDADPMAGAGAEPDGTQPPEPSDRSEGKSS